MENKMTAQMADEMLSQGFHCSQCVFSYVAERLGMDKSAALKLSAGLGGGCFHGDSCGAITGAIMALGMVYGFDHPDAREEDAVLIAKVRELEQRFIAQNGSVLCRELLNGYDKADPNAVAPENTYRNCGKYCADACSVIDELLHTHYIR